MALVRVKDKPEVGTDPQTHHLLSLCQENGAARTVVLVKKIDQLHRNDPAARGRTRRAESEALYNLASTASFFQDITAILPMPAMSGKKTQIFKFRSDALASELDSVKEVVDLSEYTAHMTKLLEEDNAERALATLDALVLEKTGTTLERLCVDLVGQCINDIHEYHKQQQTKTAQKKTEIQPYVPIIETTTQAVRIEQQRQKDKNRPARSSVFDAPVDPAEEPEVEEEAPIYKVRQSTFDTFSILFSRGQARGSIPWTDFEAAMADLNFSVIPKFGSVYTFLPPVGMGVQKSFTVHRPHQSWIEAHLLLILASRLKRVYGWGLDYFKVD